MSIIITGWGCPMSVPIYGISHSKLYVNSYNQKHYRFLDKEKEHKGILNDIYFLLNVFYIN